jgi:hypothetical protein
VCFGFVEEKESGLVAVKKAETDGVEKLVFTVGESFDVQAILNAVLDQFTFFESRNSLVRGGC